MILSRATLFSVLFSALSAGMTTAATVSHDLTLIYEGEGFTDVEIWSMDNVNDSYPDVYGPGFLAGEDNIWGLTGAFSYLSKGDEVGFNFVFDLDTQELSSCRFAGLDCMPDISPPPIGPGGHVSWGTFMGAPGGWMGGDFLIEGNLSPGRSITTYVAYNEGGYAKDPDFFSISRDYQAYFTVKPTVVPLPATLPLLGSGLLLCAALARRGRQADRAGS